MSAISIRFGTNDIRDFSNGALPASIWDVRTRCPYPCETDCGKCEGAEVKETHVYNIRSEKQKMKQARRAALGSDGVSRKHVEIRDGAYRMTGGKMLRLFK